MRDLAAAKADCERKGAPFSLSTRVAFGLLQTQSRELDSMYPWQARERAAAANARVADVALRGWGVQPVDWMSLTRDAPTSDGVHSLSDVNLAKATVLMRLLELMR